MDRHREIRGGEKRGARHPPQTPPSYIRTSKLEISHFLGEAGRIPATHTFDMKRRFACNEGVAIRNGPKRPTTRHVFTSNHDGGLVNWLCHSAKNGRNAYKGL